MGSAERCFFFDKKRLNLSLCSTNLSRAKLAVYHTLGLGSYYIGLGLVSFYQKKKRDYLAVQLVTIFFVYDEFCQVYAIKQENEKDK